MYLFMALTLLSDFLLAVMSYGRCVPICLPLYHNIIMCPQCCLLLVTTSWLCAHLLACSLSCLSSPSVPRIPSHIPSATCTLLKLTYSETHIFQVTMFAEGALLTMVHFTCVLVSCPHHPHSPQGSLCGAGGNHKIFSTCGAYLTFITLFYGTHFLVYFQSSSSYSEDTAMVASVV